MSSRTYTEDLMHKSSQDKLVYCKMVAKDRFNCGYMPVVVPQSIKKAHSWFEKSTQTAHVMIRIASSGRPSNWWFDNRGTCIVTHAWTQVPHSHSWAGSISFRVLFLFVEQMHWCNTVYASKSVRCYRPIQKNRPASQIF